MPSGLSTPFVSTQFKRICPAHEANPHPDSLCMEYARAAQDGTKRHVAMEIRRRGPLENCPGGFEMVRTRASAPGVLAFLCRFETLLR